MFGNELRDDLIESIRNDVIQPLILQPKMESKYDNSLLELFFEGF